MYGKKNFFLETVLFFGLDTETEPELKNSYGSATLEKRIKTYLRFIFRPKYSKKTPVTFCDIVPLRFIGSTSA
jgi:hypothetical protein